MLLSEFNNCLNCQYAIRMKNGWICGEYAASIEPTDKMCDKGVKRYDDTEIFMDEMASKMEQVDVPPHMPAMPLA